MVGEFPVDILKFEQQMKTSTEAFKTSLTKYRVGPASPGLVALR